MPPIKAKRVTVAFRLSPAAAGRIKSFLRDFSGKPLYVRAGQLAESALLREIDRLERQMQGTTREPERNGDTSTSSHEK